MDWLQSLDTALFRFINQGFSNSIFDRVMPWLSGNDWFVPGIVVIAAGLLWKGSTRGRLFVFFIVLALIVGDGLICNTIKDTVARPRPFHAVLDANVLVGRGRSGSLPSAHTANWFAATTLAFLFYRRSLWFMLPLASLVGFSRVYLGVHYPSDVVAGALLGVAYSIGLVWLADRTWATAGRRWFPLWWEKLPALTPHRLGTVMVAANNGNVHPMPAKKPEPADAATANNSQSSAPRVNVESHWLRLGYLVTGVLLLARLAYLASDTIELSEDEAYQWLWSKHLALSYYSKPPMIAYTQFLGTSLWGDSEFGVRFFSPVIAAILSIAMLRFISHASARVAFWIVLIVTATPLTSAGAVLMTIDPLSVLFWSLAIIAGWRAVQRDSTVDWLWTGFWMGLGFLSKYTALFQLLSWAVFFALWPAARAQLRRPGPYLALLVLALCTIPVIVWNYQNGWITVIHLANRGGLDRQWTPTARFFAEFLLAETGLLNPIFFIAMIWAAVAFWKQRPGPDGLLVYLFSMGAPLFLCYLLFTLRARVQPNWIAPSVLPLFCLMAIYWAREYERGRHRIKQVFAVGLGLGLTAVLLLHDTDLIRKLAGQPLPAQLDPLRRVRGWRETAKVVGEARQALLAEGKPVFIIGDHYGITGELSFYLPEAKAAVRGTPLVYYESADRPKNQFYFWPGYQNRKGENAIYVLQAKRPEPPPALLLKEFADVQDLGTREIVYRGRLLRTIQLFACRNLL